MMKSAKQTEQKIATLEATLLQRRDYLDSIKVRWGWSLKDLEGWETPKTGAKKSEFSSKTWALSHAWGLSNTN